MIKLIPTKEEFEKTLDKSVEYLKNEKKIISIILFGSFGKKDFSLKHSDLDLYLLIDSKKNLNFERKIWKYVNNINKKIQVHLNFEYKELIKEGSLLRYNILKEGKILFERKKTIFLKQDFNLEEVYLIKLNLSKLEANQKSNLKKSILNKYKNNILEYFGNLVIIKKNFFEDLNKKLKNKKVNFEILKEFLYREKQDFDEELQK